MANVLRFIGGLLLCLGFQGSACAYVPTLVPTQFIAKQYSEALGRIPDPGGWTAAVGYFQQNGCSTATLNAWGSSAFSSTEFQNLGYTPEEQVLLVYRAVLNREADNAGLYFYAGQLRSGALSLNQFVQIAYNSAEFGRLSPYICRALSYGYGSIGTVSNLCPPACRRPPRRALPTRSNRSPDQLSSRGSRPRRAAAERSHCLKILSSSSTSRW